MVGTWGEWNEGDFNSCSEPCGGGKINRHRICLYPPCEGEAFEITDRECNTHECHTELGFKSIARARLATESESTSILNLI